MKQNTEPVDMVKSVLLKERKKRKGESKTFGASFI